MTQMIRSISVKRLSRLFILPLYFLSFLAHSQHYFFCEKDLPVNLQIESLKHCAQTPVIIASTGEESSANLSFALINALSRNQSIGASIVNFPNNKTKTVYRSAYLALAPLCMQELHQRHVDTIINLYGGHLGFSPELSALEKTQFKTMGGKTYIQILNFEVDHVKQNQLPHLNNTIAEIINYIIHSNGDVLIHCMAGEHNTSVIFGVLHKCFNHLPPAIINKEASCHMGNSDPYELKTRAGVLDIIKQYPCDLLEHL